MKGILDRMMKPFKTAVFFSLILAASSCTADDGATTQTLTGSRLKEVERIEMLQKQLLEEHQKMSQAIEHANKKLIWVQGQYDGLERLKMSLMGNKATSATIKEGEEKK